MSNAPENAVKKKNRWFPWAWSTRGFALGVNALLLMQVSFYATELGVAQPASALSAIQWCFSLVPAILCVGMLVVLHFYDLEKNYDQIKAHLTGK